MNQKKYVFFKQKLVRHFQENSCLKERKFYYQPFLWICGTRACFGSQITNQTSQVHTLKWTSIRTYIQKQTRDWGSLSVIQNYSSPSLSLHTHTHTHTHTRTRTHTHTHTHTIKHNLLSPTIRQVGPITETPHCSSIFYSSEVSGLTKIWSPSYLDYGDEGMLHFFPL